MGVSARLLLHRPLLGSCFRPRNPNPNPRIPHNLSLRSAPFSSLSLSLTPTPSPSPALAPAAFHVWDPLLAPVAPPAPAAHPSAARTVVLLGWLGAELKHLKRYAEIYNARGIQSVRFVVPVRELLGLGLGRRVEERVTGLARELGKWCEGREEDGRERRLLFHTFSNTGWLIYGSILENWQSRSDLIERIDGCVVDSGPAPELSPQVWAAGFGAALLKKRSSLIYSGGSNQGDKFSSNDRPAITETIVLSILEKFFSVALKLPQVNQRLSRIISTLSKNQPPCPQLYLYSSADKVVPASSVEGFIQEQKAQGKNVQSHDFVSSPHVDHFRSFPHIYSEKVNDFLKECLSQAVSQ